MSGQAPLLVLNANAKRETGRKAQLGNIAAAKSVADVIRTTLGPRSMLKMILDPMGGIVMTNDGHAILREIDVSHPAAKSMIELSRTQDEEVGDGTTSVIILAGEMLAQAEPVLMRSLHPRIIVQAYMRALDVALQVMERACLPLDTGDRAQLMTLARSCLGTKFVSRFGDLICNLALDAVLKVTVDTEHSHSQPYSADSASTAPTGSSTVSATTAASTTASATGSSHHSSATEPARAVTFKRKEIDIKRYARVEKVPGGYLEDSCVLSGVMLNKDVVHPAMRRNIAQPRIMLLDCNLEFKKAESQTNLELKKEEDFEAVLRMEEEYIARVCQAIIQLKPDVVCVEKGVSDLAAHFLQKANISVLRRLRKTDNNRIARATGATICSVPEEVKEADIGKAGRFEIVKIGDEYFAFIDQCEKATACTILLRGASKDVLNEIERNLIDAMNVIRNIVLDPRIVPGGGAVEMALAHALAQEARLIEGVQQLPFKAVSNAFEVIPRTLIENCGGSSIRLLTALRAKHAQQPAGKMCTWGIDGNKGELADMVELGIFEPFAVKSQTIKTAIEAACLLLRIDDIVSGMSNKQGGNGGAAAAAGAGEGEEDTFGDARDG